MDRRKEYSLPVLPFSEPETTVTSGVPDADTVPLVDKLTPIPETRLKTDSKPRARTTKPTVELTTSKKDMTTSEPERFSPTTGERRTTTSLKTDQRFTKKPIVVESSRTDEDMTTGKLDRTTPAIDDFDRTPERTTVTQDRKIMPERQETIQPDEDTERTTAEVTYITGVKPQVGKTLVPPTATGKVEDLETVTVFPEETGTLIPERDHVTYDGDVIPEELESLTPETESRTVTPRRTTVTRDEKIVTVEGVTRKQATVKTVTSDDEAVTLARVPETPSTTPDRMFVTTDWEGVTEDRVTDEKPEISGTLLPETTDDAEDIFEGNILILI